MLGVSAVVVRMMSQAFVVAGLGVLLAGCLQIANPVLPASTLVQPFELIGDWIFTDSDNGAERKRPATFRKQEDGSVLARIIPTKPGETPEVWSLRLMEGGDSEVFLAVLSTRESNYLGAIVTTPELRAGRRWSIVLLAVREGMWPDLAAWLRSNGIGSPSDDSPGTVGGLVDAADLITLASSDEVEAFVDVSLGGTIEPLPAGHELAALLPAEPAAIDAALVYGRGMAALDAGNDRAAADHFLASATIGYAPAQFQLGLLYASGRGVAEDDATALTWYRRAALQGHGLAQYSLGNAHVRGIGVAADQTTGLMWLGASADGGEAVAKLALQELAAAANAPTPVAKPFTCGVSLCAILPDGRSLYRTMTYTPPRWYFADGALAPEELWPATP